jgi:hypothetical protein
MWRIWLRLGIAAVFAAVVIAAWARFASSPSPYEEEFALAQAGVTLLTIFLGFPALILTWSAVRAAQRTDRCRVVAALAAALVAGTLITVGVLAATISRPEQPANVGSFGPAGITSIWYQGIQYRNPNGDSLPAPRRTAGWLRSHGAWPLVAVGHVPILARAIGGGATPPAATARFYRHTHAILRPASTPHPAFLLVEDGPSYLQYTR